MTKLVMNCDFEYRLRLCFAVIISLLSFPLGVFSLGGIDTYQIIIPLVLIMQIYLIFRFKNAQLLMIITLYVFVYFLYFIPYFYQDMQLSEHDTYQIRGLFSKLLYIFYLFYAGFVLGAAKDINRNKLKLIELISIPHKTYKSVLYVLFMFGLIALVFRQGENVLAAQNPYLAYKDNLENTSALPLFAILFLFFVYYLIDKEYIRNIIFGFIFFALLVFCITRGFRMILAPMFFLLFLFYFDLRFKTWQVISVTILGFILLVFINSLKSSGGFDISDVFSEGNNKFIISHHADNLYGSVAGLGLVEENIISIPDRIALFVGFISESIMPPSYLPDQIKFPHIIGINAATGGGGLCITGLFLMIGYLGVFLFPILLVGFIRYTYEKRVAILALIASIILIFSPRWISYDFHMILRFPVFAVFMYLILKYAVIKKSINN